MVMIAVTLIKAVGMTLVGSYWELARKKTLKFKGKILKTLKGKQVLGCLSPQSMVIYCC